jgi:hypothetical protein
MKKFIFLVIILLCAGCATGSLQITPESVQGLQTSRDGKTTNGCIAANINASSGVVGGSNRVVITWGTLTNAAINFCIGK